MSEQKEWGLIGYGNVGQEVARQVSQPEVAERLGLSPLPTFVMRSSGLMAPDGISSFSVPDFGYDDFEDYPEVAFVTLPSTNDGEAAFAYISRLLDLGSTVITAEKGAIANNYSELQSRSEGFRRLGINATVGGGTRLLSVAQEYCRDIDNVSQIHLALNGTMANILSSVAPPEGNGMSLGQAVHQAVRLGYAEPGSESSYDVIRGEAQGDIPKKTAIFFNVLGLGAEPINWTDLEFELSDDEIARAVEEAKIRRFIVSMYPDKPSDKHQIGPENDIIGGFEVQQDGWTIAGGFRHIDRNPLFSPLARLTGPGNGMVIGLGPDETDGVYSVTGPGAGARPTVNTMLDDYLSKINR
jgi:homoserine dehydrogenase